MPQSLQDPAAFREMCLKANDRSQQAQLMFEMSEDKAGYFIAQRSNKFAIKPVVVWLDAAALEIACAQWLLTRSQIQAQMLKAAEQQEQA